MCIEYSGSSALMTLSVYALPGKMLRMNQAADSPLWRSITRKRSDGDDGWSKSGKYGLESQK